jgi:hypothetical protein
MCTIYIIELENSKFYVGRTYHVNNRILEHFNECGSVWTKLHHPKCIIEQHDNCDVFDEDKYVIKFMAEYGIDNVRGGTFSRIELDEHEKYVLQKMIDNSLDKCFRCGLKHFISDCKYAKLNDEYLNNLRILSFAKCSQQMTMQQIMTIFNEQCIDISFDAVRKLCERMHFEPTIIDGFKFFNKFFYSVDQNLQKE